MAPPKLTEPFLRRVSEVYLSQDRNEAATARALKKNRTTVQHWIRQAKTDGFIPEAPEPVLPPLPDPDAPPQRPRIRMQAGRPGGSKTKVMVIGDAHDQPGIGKDRFRWMGSLAADETPDVIVQIGDFLTLDSLNSHIPDETFAGRLKGTYLDDIASARLAFDAFNDGLGNFRPRKHITLGNHEHRIWRAEDKAPHVAGMMVQELTDTLDRFGWGWSPFGAYEFVGGVGFTHVPLSEMGKPMGGKTAEIRISNELCFDLVFGHTHKRRSWRAAKLGPFEFVHVVNVGCALPYGHIEHYALHHLTGWSWGVEMLTLQGGHIQEENFVSMLELERRYAR